MLTQRYEIFFCYSSLAVDVVTPSKEGERLCKCPADLFSFGDEGWLESLCSVCDCLGKCVNVLGLKYNRVMTLHLFH